MLAAKNAAINAHHLADTVTHERPAWLPPHIKHLGDVRQWVQANYCNSLRGPPIDDLDLLGDVADAFKHFELTHGRKVPRRVTSAKAIITTTTGWGQMHWGEGKFGGAEQITVQLSSGKRALSSILQNVIDMWRLALGRSLCPIGE
jgi:hypothetical protein